MQTDVLPKSNDATIRNDVDVHAKNNNQSTGILDSESEPSQNQDTTGTSAPQSRSTTPEPQQTQRAASLPAFAMIFAGGVLAGAAAFLYRRRRQQAHRQQSQSQPHPNSNAIVKPARNTNKQTPRSFKDDLFVERVFIDISSRPMDLQALLASTPTSGPAYPLSEFSIIVSDRIDVQGVTTRFGYSGYYDWIQTRSPSSAALLDQMVSAGAVIIGTVPSSPLGIPFFTASSTTLFPQSVLDPKQPTSKFAKQNFFHGGGEFGCALSVAAEAGLPSTSTSTSTPKLAVAVDEVGSALIPAACCGVYAYRPTSGVLQLDGALLGSTTLGTTCLMAADPTSLVKAGKALGIPGGGNDTAGMVSKYLVAEDLFQLCGNEMKEAAPAVVWAVKQWAGLDDAQALSLCGWIYNRIPSLKKFMKRKKEVRKASKEECDSNGNGSNGKKEKEGEVDADQVLTALASAASVIHMREWEAHSAASGFVWTSPQHCNARSDKEMKDLLTSRSNGPTPVSPSEANKIYSSFLYNAFDVTDDRYAEAISVASELSEAMRAALQEGYVFVIPTTPGPAPVLPPKATTIDLALNQELKEYYRRCEQFAALASLAGVPQVCMPIPSMCHDLGAPPLSVSVLTLQRRDLLLVKAAAKLGSIMANKAMKMWGEVPKEKRRQLREASRMGGSSAAGSSNKNNSKQKETGEKAKGSGGGGNNSNKEANGASTNGGGEKVATGFLNPKTTTTTKSAATASTSSHPSSSKATKTSTANAKGKQAKGAPSSSTPLFPPGEVAKEQGNAAFKRGKYEEAIMRYSEAISKDPKNAVYFSNRAMAFLKRGQYTLAEADCDQALEIDPVMVKALLRRGSAMAAQGLMEEAIKDFKRVLELEPRNKQAEDELQCLMTIKSHDRGDGGGL